MKKCINGTFKEMTSAEIEEYKELAYIDIFEGMTEKEISNYLIRQQLSIEDEIAILREKDENPEEYENYKALYKEAKERAKEHKKNHKNNKKE